MKECCVFLIEFLSSKDFFPATFSGYVACVAKADVMGVDVSVDIVGGRNCFHLLNKNGQFWIFLFELVKFMPL